MKRLIPVLAAAFVASFTVLASFRESHAQERMEAWPSGGVTPQRISMGVGKSRIIDLPRDAAEIFVANPRIANAVVRSPRKLYIIGMDAGQTSLYALDQQGRQIAAFELSIGRDIGELQQILHAAMPTAAITARTVNDTIILTGSVDSAEEAQRAGDIAQGFVQRSMVISAQAPGAPGESGATGAKFNGMVVNTLTIRGRDQVMLKVTVAEIDRNIAKQLGITTSSLTASWGTFTQFNPKSGSWSLTRG
jgi:pilus assembly protein CpaC